MKFSTQENNVWYGVFYTLLELNFIVDHKVGLKVNGCIADVTVGNICIATEYTKNIMLYMLC